MGEELLAVLEAERFPISSLLPLAQEGSAGAEIELGDRAWICEPLLEGLPLPALPLDLLFCAAPGLLEGRGDEVRARALRTIDLSGALELDPRIPLFSRDLPPVAAQTLMLAVPRGVVGGVAASLAPVARRAGLRRVSVVPLESASGGGREGMAELADQTLALLNSMTGEAGPSLRFPRPLAFDCLPEVGLPLEGGETSEEQRLRHGVRRLLGLPGLPLAVTRVRVPIFTGSLTLVHAELERAIERPELLGEWGESRAIEALSEELPTPRAAAGSERHLIGRIRCCERDLSFAIAQDDLRVTAATALEAARWLLHAADLASESGA